VIASAADSRPARSAGPNPASSTSANIPAGAATKAHHGTCWLPTPYAPAELRSTGAASTLPTMSTAMTRPISANATTNGSMMAPLPVAWSSAASQEAAPVTAPAGSARLTSVTSARTSP
jgi:hypothetical protein